MDFQENIVKVEPGINQNTGKASLKAKPMYDSTDDESLRDTIEGDKLEPSGNFNSAAITIKR